MIVMKVRDWLEFRGAKLLRREILYNGAKGPRIYLDKYTRNGEILYSLKLRGYVGNNFNISENGIVSAKNVSSSFLEYMDDFDQFISSNVTPELGGCISKSGIFEKKVNIFKEDVLIFQPNGAAIISLCLFEDHEKCCFSLSFNGDWEVPSRVVISLDEGRAILNKIASI